MSAGLERVDIIPGPVDKWIRTGESLTIPLLLYSLIPFMTLGWPWALMRFPEYFLTFYGLPWLAFALFRLGHLWHLMHQGYGIIDIRSSLLHWRRRRDQKVALANRKVPVGLSKAVRWGTFAALGIALTGTSTQLLRKWPEPWMWWSAAPIDLWVFAFNLTLVAGIVGWIWPRLARPATDYLADMRVRFWGSRLGDWLTSGARLLTQIGRRTDRVAIPPLRHTEVALHAGASELFAELEPAVRDKVKALPAVATDLVRQALDIRVAIGRFETLEASVLPTSVAVDSSEHNDVHLELLAKRARLEKRHREVIDALERLRLGLMRLVARAEMPFGITRSLEEAEELTQLLILLDEARQTVEDSIRLTA